MTEDNGQTQPAFDLLLKGGYLIDPAQGISQTLDVAITGDRIAAIAPDIDPQRAAKTVDVTGCLVTPGLIDMHVHVAPSFHISVVADAHSFPNGITTMVDAGSTGGANWEPFKNDVIDAAQTRVLAFLNVVDVGMGTDLEQDVSHMDVDLAARTASEYPDEIVGIKVAHYWVRQPWDAEHPPWANVERGVAAGVACGLPTMVDFWPRPPERSYADLILKKMRPGDIHTHIFGQHFPILDEKRLLNPDLRRARERGIIFDLGHGKASFWFRQAAPAFEQGFMPDSISTDLHVDSIPTAGSLLHVMGKCLHMGMPLEEVIKRVTVAPANEINRPGLGTIPVGAEADVAVLRLEEGAFGYNDCGGGRLDGTSRFECLLTLRAGQVVHDHQGLTMPLWHEAPPAYWAYQSLPLRDNPNEVKQA